MNAFTQMCDAQKGLPMQVIIKCNEWETETALDIYHNVGELLEHRKINFMVDKQGDAGTGYEFGFAVAEESWQDLLLD